MPIGNLTSQIFANIYLNELDQFVKHVLKVKNYARYTDDFIIIAEDRMYLKELLPKLQKFLTEKLKLELHPKKIVIRKQSEGVDFLGYVLFQHHRLVRLKTRKRIIQKMRKKIQKYRNGVINDHSLKSSLQSYLGVLSHADTHRFTQSFINQFWFWLQE